MGGAICPARLLRCGPPVLAERKGNLADCRLQKPQDVRRVQIAETLAVADQIQSPWRLPPELQLIRLSQWDHAGDGWWIAGGWLGDDMFLKAQFLGLI